MLALIAAVPLETAWLRTFLTPLEVRHCAGLPLYRGRCFGQTLLLLHSGPGKANAAAALAALLETNRPEAVILFGCGGAIPGSGLEIGDLALATEEVFGDEGVLTDSGFMDLQQMELTQLHHDGRSYFNRFPLDRGLQQKTLSLLEYHASLRKRRLVSGPFVTVSCCTGTDSGGLELARRTGGICENMEGAAAALVCTRYRVPLLEIRGISNLAAQRDRASWDLKGASLAAQEAVAAILEEWSPTERRA